MPVFKMPVFRLKLPGFVQRQVDRHYLDISISRILPIAGLLAFGVLVGLIFNTGVGHPYDKVIHVGFFALLTLSIHALFCCRLRISALAAFGMGIAGEIVQGFLPHHESSLADTLANGVGVAIVVTLIALIRSEVLQAERVAPAPLDLEGLGLQPVHSEVPVFSGSDSEK